MTLLFPVVCFVFVSGQTNDYDDYFIKSIFISCASRKL